MQPRSDPGESWVPLAEPPSLHGGEVHVWRFYLSPSLDDDRRLLSPDEAARAQRFAFPEHSRRFVKRRAVLRRLLAAYLDVEDPGNLRFAYGSMGKPHLALPQERLHFNASSSEDLALIAVGLEHSIGVDIELMRELPTMDSLAESSFSSAEITSYFSTPPEEREAVFYAGWTRKEAFIKAIGQGLAFPLRNVDVSMKSGEPPHILRIEGAQPGPEGWTLAALQPARGFAGAVAIPTALVTVRTFSLAS